MDVYEPLWMAPRAEFEIGLKHLMFNAPTSLMSGHTPSDTPALNPGFAIKSKAFGSLSHQDLASLDQRAAAHFPECATSRQLFARAGVDRREELHSRGGSVSARVERCGSTPDTSA
jgi:hypothetical protein